MNLSHIELLYVLQYGYIALFAVIVASEVSTFLPVGVLLIAMGALARAGYFNFLYLLIISTIASSVGDYIVFSIARHLGKQEGYRRYVKNSAFATRMERYVAKYPRATIFLSRLLGFAGTPANAMVGLSQTSRSVFWTFDLLGNLACCFLYLGVGHYLGAAWQQDSDVAEIGIGVVAGLFISSYFVFYLLFRKKTPDA